MNAAKRFGATAMIILAIVSGLAVLLPMVPWYAWLTAFLLGTLLAVPWTLRAPRPTHLPVEVLVPDDEEEATAVEVPPSEAGISASAEYAKEVYRDDALTKEGLLAWWRRNPWAFLLLRSPHGRYLGHTDVLPLTEEGARLLEEGSILEEELPLSTVLPPESMRSARVLYLAGITVRDCGTEAGKRRAAQLIGALVDYVEAIYGRTPRRLVAIAATPDGARLLQSLGARVVRDGATRRDRHDFYAVDLDEATLARVAARAARRAAPARLRIEPPPEPRP